MPSNASTKTLSDANKGADQRTNFMMVEHDDKQQTAMGMAMLKEKTVSRGAGTIANIVTPY